MSLMCEKKAILKRCGPYLDDAVQIETDLGVKEVIKVLLSVDCLVVEGGCNDPDASLVAFLARLLDKKVYWVGRKPHGLLSSLTSGKLE